MQTPVETKSQNEETRPDADKTYIKITLIKYLEYLASGNEKEAMTLEKVLFTVLDTCGKELEGLEKARRKNNTGLMSYFYTPPQVSVAKPC